MPVSGTYVHLRTKRGIHEYLLYNNERYAQYGERMGFLRPFPIKISIMAGRNNEQDLSEEDIKDIITLTYQTTRINWKSVSMRSMPITIAYAKLVAKFVPHFPDGQLTDFGKIIFGCYDITNYRSYTKRRLSPYTHQRDCSCRGTVSMMHTLRQAKERTNLIELEKDITHALDSHTQVGLQYKRDKELKDTITRYLKSVTPDYYTREYKHVLKNIFPAPEINTPYLRMYETILELEKVRTVCAILDLHSKMQDDSFIFTEVKELLNIIKGYCKELKEEKYQSPVTCLLRNMLIELYFSLFISFQKSYILKKQ